ncbi:MAG: ribosomal-processing cysteine protease Prp [Clostridia bacterium]|nr:ribosomal-processing cysteine protease Prp [Clostridia bacterium]
MIHAEFFGGKPPKGFQVSGHSGTAPAGEDLVCAAVTSAVRLTETLINDTLQVGAEVTVEESTATITLRLPDQAPKCAGKALLALQRYLKELSLECPDGIGVVVRK